MQLLIYCSLANCVQTFGKKNVPKKKFGLIFMKPSVGPGCFLSKMSLRKPELLKPLKLLAAQEVCKSRPLPGGSLRTLSNHKSFLKLLVWTGQEEELYIFFCLFPPSPCACGRWFLCFLALSASGAEVLQTAWCINAMCLQRRFAGPWLCVVNTWKAVVLVFTIAIRFQIPAN